MIALLKAHFPNFSHLQESPLRSGNFNSAWQVTALDKMDRPLGSGFSTDLNFARKVAIAEFIERNFVINTKKSPEASLWKLDQYPTACGFAAGFDPVNTKIRSIAEGIERWALSKWIDDSCPLEQDTSTAVPRECIRLARDFDNILVFKKAFLYNSENRIIPYHLCVTIALVNNGVFLGSAVRNNFYDAFAHAIVESHRHLLISTQDRNFDIYPYSRIKFFSQRQKEALHLLQLIKTKPWPRPVLAFQRDYKNHIFCVSRTIFKDWIPWERGPLNRMLY